MNPTKEELIQALNNIYTVIRKARMDGDEHDQLKKDFAIVQYIAEIYARLQDKEKAEKEAKKEEKTETE